MLNLQISLTSDTTEPHIRHQNTVQRQGSQSGGSELISHQDNDKGCKIHHGKASKKSNTHIHKSVRKSMHSSQNHVPNDTPNYQSCYVIQLVWFAPCLKYSPPHIHLILTPLPHMPSRCVYHIKIHNSSHKVGQEHTDSL